MSRRTFDIPLPAGTQDLHDKAHALIVGKLAGTARKGQASAFALGMACVLSAGSMFRGAVDPTDPTLPEQVDEAVQAFVNQMTELLVGVGLDELPFENEELNG